MSNTQSDSIQNGERCVDCGRDKAWHEPVVSEDGLIIYPPDHLFVERSSWVDDYRASKNPFPVAATEADQDSSNAAQNSSGPRSESEIIPELDVAPSSEIEVIAGSARQTTALAIRRRQLLTSETVGISDLALHLAVQFTEHRTCFNEIGHGFCTGCEDIVIAGQWVDGEMDRAGVPREARGLPYPTHNAPAPTGN